MAFAREGSHEDKKEENSNYKGAMFKPVLPVKNSTTLAGVEKSIINVKGVKEDPITWNTYCTGVIVEHAGIKYVLTGFLDTKDDDEENYDPLREVWKKEVVIENQKYNAVNKAVLPEYKLALLEVADPEFQEKAKPIEFGETLSLRQDVCAIYYYLGMPNLVLNKGITHRDHGDDPAILRSDLLFVPAGAGLLPIFANNKLVGAGYCDFEHIGPRIIPPQYIQHFLNQAFDGKKLCSSMPVANKPEAEEAIRPTLR